MQKVSLGFWLLKVFILTLGSTILISCKSGDNAAKQTLAPTPASSQNQTEITPLEVAESVKLIVYSNYTGQYSLGNTSLDWSKPMEVTSQAASGQVSFDRFNVIYEPASDFIGEDSVVIQGINGEGQSHSLRIEYVIQTHPLEQFVDNYTLRQVEEIEGFVSSWNDSELSIVAQYDQKGRISSVIFPARYYTCNSCSKGFHETDAQSFALGDNGRLIGEAGRGTFHFQEENQVLQYQETDGNVRYELTIDLNQGIFIDYERVDARNGQVIHHYESELSRK